MLAAETSCRILSSQCEGRILVLEKLTTTPIAGTEMHDCVFLDTQNCFLLAVLDATLNTDTHPKGIHYTVKLNSQEKMLNIVALCLIIHRNQPFLGQDCKILSYTGTHAHTDIHTHTSPQNHMNNELSFV